MTVSYKARAWNQDTDGNGEFEIPQVEDGVYEAHIIEVEDRVFPGYDGGPEQTKYMIDWEFDDLIKADGNPVTLRQFLTIPQGLIDSGYVHPKSKMYSFLRVMGEDPDSDSFEVDPSKWMGQKAKIWVKGKASKKDPKEVRPVIDDVRPVAPATSNRTTTTRRANKSEDDY